jgi:16S rRNA processing protein RimM
MITLEGITNINDVLKYKGKPIYINKEDLILNENEYLDEDLIGLEVIMNNKNYGKIERIEKDPYQDKIVVNKDGIFYLVPYVCDIIVSINLSEGNIELKYIKGLLD